MTSSDDEIKAVCFHELGHLNEPRKVLMMRLLVSLAFYPLVFARPISSLGGIGANAFWILIFVVLIIWWLGIRVAKRMEIRADKIAVENQFDAAVYAKVLERLYETNQMPAVMPWRSTKIHPDLYDRMLAAGVTPDYPKPKPAKSHCWTSFVMFACLFILPPAIGFTKMFIETIHAATITVR
jgi:Zn-dependent protease with chaperone function